MAAALVGAQGAVSVGSSGATVTPAYGAGSSRTAGNVLVLQVMSTGSATLPGAIAGWTIAKQQAGTSCSASIYIKTATGADAAPVVPAVTSAIHNAMLSEFSGLTGTVDQSSGVAGTTTPIVATNAAVDALTGDVMIAAGGAINSVARTHTITHTFTNAGTLGTTNNATSTVSHYSFAYGVTNVLPLVADKDSMAFSTTSLTGAVVALATLRASPNPKAATLIDPMHGSSVNATLWGTLTGTVSESSSGLLITNPVNYTGYGGTTSVLPYDLTGSSFSVRLVNPGDETINSWETQLLANADPSNFLQWLLNKNSFLAQYKLAGSTVNIGTLAYNPAIHKYVRFREAGGTTFWDWSTDGITWTNVISHANLFAVTALQAGLSAGTYNLETTATSTTYDNFGGPGALLAQQHYRRPGAAHQRRSAATDRGRF